MINDADAFLRNVLLTVKTVAMVGASDKETRPSYVVSSVSTYETDSAG